MAKSRSKKPHSKKPGAPRPRAHSLLEHYGKRSKSNHTVAIQIEDPYSTTAYATVTKVPPPGRSTPNGHTIEWRSPPKPRIEVLASTRDVIAGMFARRQIDEAMFNAAREYQQTYERARALQRLRSVDPSMPPISGAQSTPYEAAAMALAATNELKRLEKALHARAGEDGVDLVRDVIGAGKTIERAAVERGDRERKRVEWWGGLFRRSLKHLAEISGFAVPHAYRHRNQQMRREQKREKREKREKTNGDARSEGSGPESTQAGVQGYPIGGDLRPVAL
jgi:hypothetical protein